MKLIDKTLIRESLGILFETGNVFEIRALDAANDSDRRTQTWTGYFDDPVKAADAIEAARFTKFSGIYWTLNPVDPNLLARAVNKLRPAGKTPTTGDKDVTTRRWLLIDCDVIRLTGIASSDAERALARQRGNMVDEYLAERGFPSPIHADSGNGRHLLYRIDLPADDGGLIERILKTLAQQFADDTVKIDTGVFNPSRICRQYGAINGKGDPDAATLDPPRPQRIARFDQVPDTIDIVPHDALERAAAEYDEPESTAPQQTNSPGEFDLDALLRNAPFEIEQPKPYQGGRKWIIPTCPWNTDHKGGSAFIIQRSNGAIQAGCHHNGCKDRKWHDLRDILDPGWREKRDRLQESQAWPNNTNPKRSKRIRYKPISAWIPFPTDALPEPFRGFVRELAHSIQCDEALVAVPLLVVMANAIGATRRLRLTSTWLVPASIWAAVIAKSGSKKTPSLNGVKRLLSDIQESAFREHAENMMAYERVLAIHEADMNAWKSKGIAKGEPPPEKPIEPTASRYLFDDATLESLAVLLEQNPRGLAGMIDELGGWLNSFGQYKGKSGSDMERWLELFNGNPIMVDRKGSKDSRRTIYVPRTAVSLCGGIQPAALLKAFGRLSFENGLAARLLLFSPLDRVPVWRDDESPLQYESRVRARLDALLALQFEIGPDDKTNPLILKLDDAAKPIWGDWYNTHNRERPTLDDDLGAAWSKLEQYAARIALILQLAENPDSLLVDRATLENAIRLTDWFKNEAKRVYAEFTLTPEQRETQRTIELIRRRGGRIRQRELQSSDRRFRGNAEAAEQELQALVDSGFGHWESIPPGPNGGRATREFVLDEFIDEGLSTEP